MADLDASRKYSITYPSEKQRNSALDILRPPALSSHVCMIINTDERISSRYFESSSILEEFSVVHILNTRIF